jgi:hypothetical protein
MPKNEIESKLTSADKKALAKHEETIRSGLTSFIEVGHALAEIRDSQLYRDSHKSFEAYCQERWDIGARQAHYKIAAAEVIDNLRSAKSISHMPSFETHAIELSKAGDKATKVWAAVLKASPMAEDGTVCTTVKKIAEVRDAMLKPKADPPPPAQPQAPKDEPPRKDKATDSAASETPEDEPPKVVNGIGKHEDVEEPGSDNPFPKQTERMELVSRQLTEISGRLGAVLKDIESLKGEGFDSLPNRENIEIAIQNMIDGLHAHAHTLKTCAPACMCLECKGNGCQFCQHRRYQTVGERKEYQSRTKATASIKAKAAGVTA